VNKDEGYGLQSTLFLELCKIAVIHLCCLLKAVLLDSAQRRRAQPHGHIALKSSVKMRAQGVAVQRIQGKL
jgi:hypothetical protein